MSGYWTLETFTPDRASYLLENCRRDNKDRLPPAVEERWMEHFAGIIRRGEWVATPQGITLGLDDFLADGVHRLGGVVRSGIAVEVWVYRDDKIKSVHDLPLDQGKQREHWFVAGKNRNVVSVATLALRTHCGAAASSVLSTAQIAKLADIMTGTWEELGFPTIPKIRRLARSAPFQLACLTHLANGTASPEYIKKVVKALIEDEPASLPPYFLAFLIQYNRGKKHQSKLAPSRIFRALTEKLGQQSHFKVAHDTPEFTQAVRKAFGSHMPVASVPMVPKRGKHPHLKWTDEEINIVARGSRENWSVRKIAVVCRRTVGAVRSKASDLGISLETIN